MHHYAMFETAAGFCGIAWSESGIVRFQLPTSNAAGTERLLKRRLPDAVPGTPPSPVAETIVAAKAYFAGSEMDFSDCVLDLAGRDAFARQIYAAARRIGWGHTTTYGTLARELGASPEAARDVGRAMAENPVPLIIPCHRAGGGRPARRLLSPRRCYRQAAHAGAGGDRSHAAAGAAVFRLLGTAPASSRISRAVSRTGRRPPSAGEGPYPSAGARPREPHHGPRGQAPERAADWRRRA